MGSARGEGCYTGYSSDYVATEPSCVWTQPAREGGRPYKPHPSKKPVTHTQCAFRSRNGLMYTGGTERALTALLARACQAAIGSCRCNRSQRRTPPHSTYATTCTVGVRGTASEEPPVSLGCLHASKMERRPDTATSPAHTHATCLHICTSMPHYAQTVSARQHHMPCNERLLCEQHTLCPLGHHSRNRKIGQHPPKLADSCMTSNALHC